MAIPNQSALSGLPGGLLWQGHNMAERVPAGGTPGTKQKPWMGAGPGLLSGDLSSPWLAQHRTLSNSPIT